MSLLNNIFRNLCNQPATRTYPFTERAPFTGARGHLEIVEPKCVYCGICAKKCPSIAIQVTKKPAQSWTLNRLKCIVCGYCVEACPKGALVMAETHKVNDKPS